MRKWKKALACVLTFALCIPALVTTAFGALYQSNNGGDYFHYTTFSEEEMTKYVPMVYEVGDNSTATATGYAQFYDTHNGKTADDFLKKGMIFDTNATMDEIHPTGNMKFVIHDGVMVITNELTADETYAMAKQAMINRGLPEFDLTESNIRTESEKLTSANFLNTAPASGYGTTPIRENANIETIIFGDNVTSTEFGGAFWKLPNLKNVIFVDGGTNSVVYSNTPIETVIMNASGDEDMATATSSLADKVVYDTPAGGWGSVQYQYKANTKGSIVVNRNTGNAAAQQAGAKSLIAGMNLPDWALAFLPTEVGGTEKVRTVDEVFNFSTGEMLSNWGGTSQTVEETPAVTQPAYTTDSPKVDAWANDFYTQAKGFGLLPTDGVLGSDYTVKITRAQFAALAVTTYERVLNTTVPVNDGDTTFADCTGNEYVAKAYNLGILSGYNSAATRAGVSVGPNDPITREQAAVMLARLMTVYSETTGGVQPAKAESLPFKDTASSWALDGIATVYEHGIMAGTSATTFDGKANYTIEQAVVTMYRYFNWVGYGVSD